MLIVISTVSDSIVKKKPHIAVGEVEMKMKMMKRTEDSGASEL